MDEEGLTGLLVKLDPDMYVPESKSLEKALGYMGLAVIFSREQCCQVQCCKAWMHEVAPEMDVQR
jgi:hypothetical protein